MNEAQDHVFHQISRRTKSKVQFPLRDFFLKGFTVAKKNVFFRKIFFWKKTFFLAVNPLRKKFLMGIKSLNEELDLTACINFFFTNKST